MTRIELEARVRELEQQVAILKMQQQGDIEKFAELLIIRDRFNEAIIILRSLSKIGKWGMRSGAAIIAVIVYVKGSAIWQAVKEALK